MENVLGHLTDKNRRYLELRLEGKKVYEAYVLAGYDGEKSAAYVLESRLNRELGELLKAKGMSEVTLYEELHKLNEIPLQNVDSLTVNQKIRVLGLMQNALAAQKKTPQSFTQININSGPKPIDVEIVPEIPPK